MTNPMATQIPCECNIGYVCDTCTDPAFEVACDEKNPTCGECFLCEAKADDDYWEDHVNAIYGKGE